MNSMEISQLAADNILTRLIFQDWRRNHERNAIPFAYCPRMHPGHFIHKKDINGQE